MGASVIQMALALYFATVLTFSTRFKSLFKGILFFPYLINGVAFNKTRPAMSLFPATSGTATASPSASSATTGGSPASS